MGGPGANEYLFAQDFTEELKKIGIDATLQGFADQPPFFSKVDNGDFDIGFWWFCGATVDPVELYAGYECKDVVPIGELPKRGNSIRACDPEFDAVVEKLKTITPDDPAANDLYMQAYDLWMKNAFGVPLVQTIYTHILQHHLLGQHDVQRQSVHRAVQLVAADQVRAVQDHAEGPITLPDLMNGLPAGSALLPGGGPGKSFTYALQRKVAYVQKTSHSQIRVDPAF